MARWKTMIARAFRWSAYAIGVSVLAWFSLNSLLGLAGVGLVPAAVLGGWFAVAKANSEKRAWWLGWGATLGAAIPTCPWWNGAIPAAAWWLSQHTAITAIVAWDYLEFAALILTAVAPVLTIGMVGIGVASLARYVHRRALANPNSTSNSTSTWRFSLRELMVTIAVFGLVLGWNMEWVRRGQAARRENQRAFLERFTTSFDSGQVELLAEPTLEGLHRSVKAETGYRVFQTPGISEYRITAPIREAGREKWAVWCYTCGPDNSMGGEHVFQFGYAEALSKTQLPAFPFPPKRYVQYSWQMIDGFPSTAGPSATIIASPASLSLDQPLVVKASAPAGTTCRLALLPRDSTISPIADQKPNAKGAVEWSIMIQPQYAGGSIRVEVQCREPRGNQVLMNATSAPNVRLLPASPLK